MKTFAARFKAAREAAEFSQRGLGKRLGISGSAISQWEDETPKGTNPENIKAAVLQMAAGLLKVSVQYLLTGKSSEMGEVPDGLSGAAPDVREVPVISLVEAGWNREDADPYPRGEGEYKVAVDANLAGDLSRLVFALEISGESMLPDFSPGDIVIIDPMVSPMPGDYVVAKVDSESKATFKKYRNRGIGADGVPVFELVPLNPDFPTLTVSSANPGRIVGTMMEHRRRRRRR